MRTRLVFSFVLIVLITASVFLLLAMQNFPKEVGTFVGRGGMMGLEQVVLNLEDYYHQTGSWSGVDTVLASSRSGRGVGGQGMGQGMGAAMMNGRMRVADAKGTVIADTGGTPQGILSTADKQSSIALRDSIGNQVGYLYVEGGIPSNPGAEQYLTSRLINIAWTAVLIAGLVGLVLALFLSFQLLKPVQALTYAARALAGGDLDQRVPIKGKDEVAELGQAFNSMAASIQQEQNTRKSMTADIAHELRTPLSVQRAYLEAMVDGVYPLTEENLNTVLDQNHFLSRLVDDLRILALADAGELKLEFAPGDLNLLIEKTTGRFKPTANEKGIALEFNDQTAGQLSEVPLDVVRMGQVLNNLVGNALAHTPSGGKVELCLKRIANKAVITVHDSGPGIPDDKLEKIFDRFYRVDQSRSRDEGGTGLGLAITRKLVEAHRGVIVAGNDPKGGAVFTVSLPVA